MNLMSLLNNYLDIFNQYVFISSCLASNYVVLFYFIAKINITNSIKTHSLKNIKKNNYRIIYLNKINHYTEKKQYK